MCVCKREKERERERESEKEALKTAGKLSIAFVFTRK